MQRFTDKVVLITGGGTGIGRAAAIKFAAEGGRVVLGNRNVKAGEAVVKEIESAGGVASFRRTDVTVEDDIKALVEHAVGLHGKLDVAFNNAGVEGATAALHEHPDDDYRFVMDVNVRGVFWSMRHEVPAMLASGGGAIVNNASIAGSIGFPQHGVYAASKHAVMGLTRSAALEYGSRGVRVNAVSPAAIETDMLDRFSGDTAEQREQTKKYMVGMHPIGRLGKAEEIADAVLWLASDQATFMLGANLLVDGGFTAI